MSIVFGPRATVSDNLFEPAQWYRNSPGAMWARPILDSSFNLFVEHRCEYTDLPSVQLISALLGQAELADSYDDDSGRFDCR